MTKYLKHAVTSVAASILLLSVSGCGGSEESAPVVVTEVDKVNKLAQSPTVQKAFDDFNNFDFDNATKASEATLIESLKDTLNNPIAGDSSPDIATSIALIELFDLAKDPVISKYFSISIKDYPTLVSSLTEYSDASDVNSLLDDDITNALSNFDLGALLGKGFSYDLPQPAHEAALKFKKLSDALKGSFPDDSYVFRYWETEDFDGAVATYLRVGLLTSASMLELISSYSYGQPEDYGTEANNYSTVLYDPVSVLNAQQVFVFPESADAEYTESVKRLKNAKALLVEAMTLSDEIDIKSLPDSDIDYYASRTEIQAVLNNLTAADGTKDTYDYDLGTFKPYLYINFQAMFTPATAIDIKDFGTNVFYYDCGKKASYSLEDSISDGSLPICSDGSTANVRLNEKLAGSISDDDTNFDELVVDMVAAGVHFGLSTEVLMPELFSTINDAAK